MGHLDSIHIEVSKKLGEYILSFREGIYWKSNRQRVRGGERPKYEISQRDMAKKLGLSPQFLGRIEKGCVATPDDVQVRMIVEMKISSKILREIYRKATDSKVKLIMEEVKRFKAC